VAQRGLDERHLRPVPRGDPGGPDAPVFFEFLSHRMPTPWALLGVFVSLCLSCACGTPQASIGVVVLNNPTIGGKERPRQLRSDKTPGLPDKRFGQPPSDRSPKLDDTQLHRSKRERQLKKGDTGLRPPRITAAEPASPNVLAPSGADFVAMAVVATSGSVLPLKITRSWLPVETIAFHGLGNASFGAMPSHNCHCPPTSFRCLLLCALRHLWSAHPRVSWYLVVSDVAFVSLVNTKYHLQNYDPEHPWAIGDFADSSHRFTNLTEWPPEPEFNAAPCGLAFSHPAVQIMMNQSVRLGRRADWERCLAQNLGIRLHSSEGFHCAPCDLFSSPNGVAICPSRPHSCEVDNTTSPTRLLTAAYRPAVIALPAGRQPPQTLNHGNSAIKGNRAFRALQKGLDAHDHNATLECDRPAKGGVGRCRLCRGGFDRRLLPTIAAERYNCSFAKGNQVSARRRETSINLVQMLVFENEIDVLEIKFHETYDVTDLYVITESNLTFQGQPRRLVFPRWRNHPRFSRFADKIRHIVVSIDGCNGTWACETQQRTDSIRQAGLRANDLVFVTDSDEIISRDTARRLRDCEYIAPIGLELFFYYYSVKITQPASSNAKWVVVGRTADQILSGSGLRDSALTKTRIHEAGWHISYAGGPLAIRRKLQSFSHIEYSRPPFTTLAYIADHIERGADLFNRTSVQWEAVDNLTNLPLALKDRPCDFPLLFDPLMCHHLTTLNDTKP
jgi:beta-1,4-mannosyl-glycoprotein beta-1,4-N-acetylglucosaminyltransferase